MYAPEVLALAEENGIPAEDLPLIINGCSGGFSMAYRLAMGRAPSCEACCNMHDLRYQLGGTGEERKAADRALRDCAAKAGSFPDGWRGDARRIWRKIRADVLYVTVRVFGRWYWN